MKIRKVLCVGFALLVGLGLSSCATLLLNSFAGSDSQASSASAAPPSGGAPAGGQSPNLRLESETQARLAKAARSLVGRSAFNIDGQKFNADCSGTMLAVFYLAGLDLRADFSRARGGNGVERLYRMMEKSGLLSTTDLPAVGSLLFWDDTYDKNGDGKADDPFAHVGIVVSAKENGDITFVHYHYIKGVVEEPMNLKEPATFMERRDGKDVVVNAKLRMVSWKPDSKTLASELYRAAGQAYKYKPQ
jgi:hypothetical protein